MNAVVFISDLHLHPDNLMITQRFNRFIDWAATNTRSLYILGDFFHVWSGDDGMEPWSVAIAKRLYWLSQQGVRLYFMPGNRDFLVGAGFVKLAGMTLIKEPTIVQLGHTSVLLAHGDGYCTKDHAHQWFRRLTRNRLFVVIFLKLPLTLRRKLVDDMRQASQKKPYKPDAMEVVPKTVLRHMQRHSVTTLIHGHTHKPGLTQYNVNGKVMNRYVLSDWDDTPQVLCYDEPKGIYFTHLTEV